jgi:Ca2+-transporting ATPase
MILDNTLVEAGERLKQHGYNELAVEGPKNNWRIALEVTREPMFLLPMEDGTLHMILGDYQDDIMLVSSILIILGITFAQC